MKKIWLKLTAIAGLGAGISALIGLVLTGASSSAIDAQLLNIAFIIGGGLIALVITALKETKEALDVVIESAEDGKVTEAEFQKMVKEVKEAQTAWKAVFVFVISKVKKGK